MNERKISELTVSVFEWAIKHGGDGAHARPGCWVGRTQPAGVYGSLDVKINPHMEECDGISPATARITSDEAIRVCFCNPYGGVLGGFNEEDLIDHFKSQPDPSHD